MNDEHFSCSAWKIRNPDVAKHVAKDYAQRKRYANGAMPRNQLSDPFFKRRAKNHVAEQTLVTRSRSRRKTLICPERLKDSKQVPWLEFC
jgi:hypothetical protein